MSYIKEFFVGLFIFIRYRHLKALRAKVKLDIKIGSLSPFHFWKETGYPMQDGGYFLTTCVGNSTPVVPIMAAALVDFIRHNEANYYIDAVEGQQHVLWITAEPRLGSGLCGVLLNSIRGVLREDMWPYAQSSPGENDIYDDCSLFNNHWETTKYLPLVVIRFQPTGDEDKDVRAIKEYVAMYNARAVFVCDTVEHPIIKTRPLALAFRHEPVAVFHSRTVPADIDTRESPSAIWKHDGQWLSKTLNQYARKHERDDVAGHNNMAFEIFVGQYESPPYGIGYVIEHSWRYVTMQRGISVFLKSLPSTYGAISQPMHPTHTFR